MQQTLAACGALIPNYGFSQLSIPSRHDPVPFFGRAIQTSAQPDLCVLLLARAGRSLSLKWLNVAAQPESGCVGAQQGFEGYRYIHGRTKIERGTRCACRPGVRMGCGRADHVAGM